MAANKTIKFFISSTFKDFLKERNALQNFVFPRLKKLCSDHGFYFQPVDLRWGVTEESSEDNKTMDYCLNEVKRCSSDPKPNLLILFGQRYGWGPLPSYIRPNVFNETILKNIQDYDFTKEEFPRALKKWQNDIDKENNEVKKVKLQKDLEDVKSYKFEKTTVKELLKEWYIQDFNDVEEKYFLKDKKGLHSLIWRFVENVLKNSIQNIEEIKNEPSLYKQFHTSATEQEIRYALKEQYKADSDNTIVYFREFEEGAKDKELIEEYQSAKDKLKDLKEYLKDCSLSAIDHDNIDINRYLNVEKECSDYDELSNDLQYFCDNVLRKFEKYINTEIQKFKENYDSDLKIELNEQTRFLQSKYLYDDKEEKRSIDVVGRKDEVKSIKNFVKNGNQKQFYLLYGKSGSGKTSVMSKAISDLQKENENIIYRFIGTTGHTTSPRDTYEYIYWQLTEPDADKKPTNIKPEDQEFYLQFQEALATNAEDKKVTLFIDAVDQFNTYDNLEIFLKYVPDNVKVVFSCLYDEEKSDNIDYVTYFKVLEHIEKKIELTPLDNKSNQEILEKWLKNTGRQLQKKQLKVIEKNVANKSPLFLRLTFEIVREWTSNNSLAGNKKELGDTEEELIIKFFKNIVDKHYVKEDLLEMTLGLISASKDGLSESELIDVLSNEKYILSLYEREGSSYPKLKKLPDSIFSKMYYHIQDIFTEKLIDNEMLISPYHRIIEEVIKKEFYEKKPKPIEFHIKLANYFYALQDKEQTWDKRYYNLHMLGEYPYQLFHSKKSKKLKEILFDLEFAGSIYNNHKQESFRNILKKSTQLDDISEENIYPWESFYREKEHLITKIDEESWRPHQSFFQLTYEDGSDSPLSIQSSKLIKDNKVFFAWMKNKQIPIKFYRDDSILIKSPHSEAVLWVTELSSKKILSYGLDFNLYLHDQNGLLLKKIELDKTDSVYEYIVDIKVKEFNTGHFIISKVFNKDFKEYLMENSFFNDNEVKKTIIKFADKYMDRIPEHKIELGLLSDTFENYVYNCSPDSVDGEYIERLFDEIFHDYPLYHYLYDSDGNNVTYIYQRDNDIASGKELTEHFNKQYKCCPLNINNEIKLSSNTFLHGNDIGELHWCNQSKFNSLTHKFELLKKAFYKHLIQDRYVLKDIDFFSQSRFLDYNEHEELRKNKGLITLSEDEYMDEHYYYDDDDDEQDDTAFDVLEFDSGIAYYFITDNEENEKYWKRGGYNKIFSTHIYIEKDNSTGINVTAKFEFSFFKSMFNMIILDNYLIDTDIISRNIEIYGLNSDSDIDVDGVYVMNIERFTRLNDSIYVVFDKHKLYIFDKNLGVIRIVENSENIVELYQCDNLNYITVSNDNKVTLWTKFGKHIKSNYIVGANTPLQYLFENESAKHKPIKHKNIDEKSLTFEEFMSEEEFMSKMKL